MGIATPAGFAYITDTVEADTVLELDCIQKIAEVEYHVLSLGAFLRYVRYAPISRLSYPGMVFGCVGGGALLHLQLY